MKKFFLILVAVAGLISVQAQQHVEFKWHRMYGVAGVDFSTNINTLKYEDKATFTDFFAVCGWQIRKESGIGLGVEYKMDHAGGYSQLPVFIEVRSHYLRNQLTPFTSAYVGYSFPLGMSGGTEKVVQILKGGPTWGLNVGARYAFSRKLGINAFVGYQGIFLDSVDLMVDGKRANSLRVLMQNVKVGVGFNF